NLDAVASLVTAVAGLMPVQSHLDAVPALVTAVTGLTPLHQRNPPGLSALLVFGERALDQGQRLLWAQRFLPQFVEDSGVVRDFLRFLPVKRTKTIFGIGDVAIGGHTVRELRERQDGEEAERCGVLTHFEREHMARDIRQIA